MRMWAGCDAIRDAHVQGKLLFRAGAGCDTEGTHNNMLFEFVFQVPRKDVVLAIPSPQVPPLGGEAGCDA